MSGYSIFIPGNKFLKSLSNRVSVSNSFDDKKNRKCGHDDDEYIERNRVDNCYDNSDHCDNSNDNTNSYGVRYGKPMYDRFKRGVSHNPTCNIPSININQLPYRQTYGYDKNDDRQSRTKSQVTTIPITLRVPTKVSQVPQVPIIYRPREVQTEMETKSCNNKGEISVRKCLLAESNATYNNIDVKVLLFDINIINNSNKKLVDISINDSILSLIDTLKYVAIELYSYSDTLMPLNNDELQRGELLDPCKSYVDPCESCRLMVKLVTKNLVGVNGDTKLCDLYTAHNTIILTGKLISTFNDGWKKEEDIDPIFYVSSASCPNDRGRNPCKDDKGVNCDREGSYSDLYELIES